DPVLASSELASASADELRHSSNVNVIVAAGRILSQYGVFAKMATKGAIDQDALSETLLLAAERLDASDFGSARALGELYNARTTHAQSADERVFWAKKQLEQMEIAVERTRSNAEWHLDSM